jgi:hypothetical protein
MTNPMFLNRLMDDGRDKVAKSKTKHKDSEIEQKEDATDGKVYHTL